MSAKANYFKLGMFIILAIVLGIAAVLVLGAGRLFHKKYIIETYLEQSVQGIDVGSKVKYRGVTIGNVRSITFTRDHYSGAGTGPTNHSYVLVELEVTSLPFAMASPDELGRTLPQEVRHGLRTRLTSQGVTGTSYVEIDYLDPAKYPLLPIDWEPANPYIPSAPSVLSKIVNSAEELFSELDKIDFTKMANSAERLIASLEQKVEQLPLGMLGTNAASLLADVRETNQRLQKLLDRPELDSLLKDASGAAAGLRRTAESPALSNSVAQLQRTLRRIDQLAAGKDNDLEIALGNLRVLTENLKELSENAKLFPAQLLFGEPPKPISP
jgi:phospholipid/cholesterol/gamma-HCH transport system substrate-binding protein/paraquat-inducible protein B